MSNVQYLIKCLKYSLFLLSFTIISCASVKEEEEIEEHGILKLNNEFGATVKILVTDDKFLQIKDEIIERIEKSVCYNIDRCTEKYRYYFAQVSQEYIEGVNAITAQYSSDASYVGYGFLGIAVSASLEADYEQKKMDYEKEALKRLWAVKIAYTKKDFNRISATSTNLAKYFYPNNPQRIQLVPITVTKLDIPNLNDYYVLDGESFNQIVDEIRNSRGDVFDEWVTQYDILTFLDAVSKIYSENTETILKKYSKESGFELGLVGDIQITLKYIKYQQEFDNYTKKSIEVMNSLKIAIDNQDDAMFMLVFDKATTYFSVQRDSQGWY